MLRQLTDLQLPEAEIRARADGDISVALQLAAAYGYAVACRDLDHVSLRPSSSAHHD